MNKVILIGNLARDPELKTTTSGKSVCSFTLAINRAPKADGTREADFIPVITWEKLADNCARFLTKGRKCAVVGAMETRSYEGKDGAKRYVTEVIAREVEFLSAPDKDGAHTQSDPSDIQPKNTANKSTSGDFMETEDDDLPF